MNTLQVHEGPTLQLFRPEFKHHRENVDFFMEKIDEFVAHVREASVPVSTPTYDTSIRMSAAFMAAHFHEWDVFQSNYSLLFDLQNIDVYGEAQSAMAMNDGHLESAMHDFYSISGDLIYNTPEDGLFLRWLQQDLRQLLEYYHMHYYNYAVAPDMWQVMGADDEMGSPNETKNLPFYRHLSVVNVW